MSKGRAKSKYPNFYGRPIEGTHINMLTPLVIDSEGQDSLVPPNDMHSVGGKIGDRDYVSPDPAGYLADFGDGTSDD